MIVKKVAKKVKGNFSTLSNYLMDNKNNNEKVEEFKFTNCNFEDYELNVHEITSTQQANTASKIDKTYHLIVSFQEDEIIDSQKMEKIEEELVKALKFEKHQRLSVVHGNTNNLHLHIAINQIDPETLKIHDPFRDVKILQEKAVELEEKYYLKRDNHSHIKIEDKNVDKTIDKHSGLKSFLTWIKDEAGEDIKKTLNDKDASFENLQKTLNKYNLEIRERGAGLVISDKSRALFVKASDVSRSLTKTELTKRYYNFDVSIKIDEKALKRFGMDDNNSLWQEYQEQQQKTKLNKTELLTKLDKQSKEEFEQFKINYEKRRTYIKHQTSNILKKSAYKHLANEKKRELEEIKAKIKRIRTKIYDQNQASTFSDFLLKKASDGNKEAIDLLQKRELKEKSLSNNVIGNRVEAANKNTTIIAALDPKISKQGIVFYKLDNAKIIDHGKILKLAGESSDENLKIFSDVAKIKFGKEALHAKGDKKFKQKLIEYNEKTSLGLKLKTTNNLKEEYNNEQRGKLSAADDKRRLQIYISNARDIVERAGKHFEDVISKLRNLGSTWNSSINERITDVHIDQTRSNRVENGINTNSATRTATNRERNGSIQNINKKTRNVDILK